MTIGTLHFLDVDMDHAVDDERARHGDGNTGGSNAEVASDIDLTLLYFY